MTVIPTPMQTDKGEWIDDISLDPGFDCEFLTCVSYQGSNAYCTRKCEFPENCPDGFDCVSVIASDPGPDSNIGPNDKFCVRQEVQFSCEP